MKIIPLASTEAMQKALNTLRDGGVLILPTDTVYGIGCDALLENAEERISRIKGRDPEKRVAWLFSDVAMAEEFVEIPEVYRDRIAALWPGAFTGIFWRRDKKSTIGVRIPNHDFVRSLIREFGRPLATSSLNKTGQQPAMKSADLATFEADLAIDGGDLPDNMASTVVDFTSYQPRVLRKGPIDTFVFQ